MEPSKLDRAIRESLNGHLFGGDNGEKERIWNSVEKQLHREPSRRWWKVAALILLLLLPSAVLWMQNRRQAATIEGLGQQLTQLSGNPMTQSPSAKVPSTSRLVVVHDTVVRHQPAVVYTKTDTITQIQIVTDTVVVYRQSELASGQESSGVILSGNPQPTVINPPVFQESQRAEFLLNPDEMSRGRKQKTNRSFTLRFSLGGSAESSFTPAGIQTRL